MYIDKWANFPKKIPEFIFKVFFGNIEYYLTYEFEGEMHMLAYSIFIELTKLKKMI